MSDYNAECPRCKGQVYLTGAVISTNIPVQPDGWCYGEEQINSTDEVFYCLDCNRRVPSAYVFGVMDREKAARRMGNGRKP